jgi:hypothetical protein
LFRAKFKTDYSTGHTGIVELIDDKGVRTVGCTLSFATSKEAICSLPFADPTTTQGNYIISVLNTATPQVVMLKSDFTRKY